MKSTKRLHIVVLLVLFGSLILLLAANALDKLPDSPESNAIKATITSESDSKPDTLRIISARRTEHGVEISFATVVGDEYRLERNNDLATSGWRIVTETVGNGGIVQVKDAEVSRTLNRFYRIRAIEAENQDSTTQANRSISLMATRNYSSTQKLLKAGGSRVVHNDGSLEALTVSDGCPNVTENKLVADDASAISFFGLSVAISGDTAVAAAPSDDGKAFNAGAAYVFVRTGAGWLQQQKLLAHDGASEDSFGGSVAISGDTIGVGAEKSDGSVLDSGAVYVFVRSPTGWVEQQKLTADIGQLNAGLGFSVAPEVEKSSHESNSAIAAAAT